MKEKRGAKPGERRGGRGQKFGEASETISIRVPKSKKAQLKKEFENLVDNKKLKK